MRNDNALVGIVLRSHFSVGEPSLSQNSGGLVFGV